MLVRFGDDSEVARDGRWVAAQQTRAGLRLSTQLDAMTSDVSTRSKVNSQVAPSLESACAPGQTRLEYAT